MLERLRGYSWPGNVRELENIIERAVILSPGNDLVIEPEMLPSLAPESDRAGESVGGTDALVGSARNASPRGQSPKSAHRDGESRVLEDVQRAHIIEELRRTGWKIEGQQGAAAALGMHPSTLRSRMKKLQIRRSDETS